MRYLIGIDIGTSATKTVLFDESCQVVASASQEYPLYQPQNGWAEQDPREWWSAICDTIPKVLAQGDIRPEEISGIGIDG